MRLQSVFSSSARFGYDKVDDSLMDCMVSSVLASSTCRDIENSGHIGAPERIDYALGRYVNDFALVVI